jgi:hypothetical protein
MKLKIILNGGEEFVAVELLHIAEIDQCPTSEDPPIYKPENDQI